MAMVLMMQEKMNLVSDRCYLLANVHIVRMHCSACAA